MDEAPKEIWAYAFTGDKFHGKWHASDPTAFVGECPRYLRADLAAAQVAAAYERAFRAAFRACKSADAGYVDENSRIAQRIENELRLEVSKAIKNLATDDQTDALEAVEREARNEGRREAAELLPPGNTRNEILALIEKGPDHE